MHKWAISAVSLLIFAWGSEVPTRAQGIPRPLDVAGGVSSQRLIVRLQSEAMQKVVAAQANHPALQRDLIPAVGPNFQTLAVRWRVSGMRPLYERPFADPVLAGQLGLDRVFVLDVPAGSDVHSMAEAFAGLAADIESAFPDTIGGVAFVPDDPDFGLQYSLNNTGQVAGGSFDADIDAVEAWDIHTGDAGLVTIAIIDSGVDPHIEYSTRMVAGRNTADPGNPNLTTDACPHGTHVAGIAAASGNNGLGMAGVTWGANIMPVRVLTGCSGFASHLASGIVWAADNGADVLNMSVQYYNLTSTETQNLQSAVNYAYGLGCVLVGAAGNFNIGGAGTIAYPARLTNVLGVSATDQSDAFATFSNYGNSVDLCAPGKDIWSTWPGNTYTYQFGTSFSAPLVSGTGALLWSYAPTMTNAQVMDLLQFSTDDLGPVGWDNRFGHGRLNALSVLENVACVEGAAALETAGAEPVPVAKSRAISFVPGNPGINTALRVKLVSLHHPVPPYAGGAVANFSAFEGQYRWVGPAVEYSESLSSTESFQASMLQCTPYFTDWSLVGLVHVLGAEIVPSSVYQVQAVVEGCPTGSAFVYSAALDVGTGRWGDVIDPFAPDPRQQPDISDVSALVDKFRSLPDAPIKIRSLLAGQIPDPAADLDFSHIAACIDAFRGLGYPYAGPQACGN